jgi:hypothetical protein
VIRHDSSSLERAGVLCRGWGRIGVAGFDA